MVKPKVRRDPAGFYPYKAPVNETYDCTTSTCAAITKCGALALNNGMGSFDLYQLTSTGEWHCKADYLNDAGHTFADPDVRIDYGYTNIFDK